MADRTFYPAVSGGVGRVYIEIKLKLNGAGAVTILSGANWLKAAGAITHVGGSNDWEITMRDAWPEIVAHSVEVRDDAANGPYATLGEFANEGSQAVPPLPVFFELHTFNAGGSALNDSTLTVSITMAIRNSGEIYGN
jgi:hypothetical protein